ncbi:hypothetical protein ONZ45_g15507 [Pleurotus djamor]|nr:hypothetical protein ONZ45_g15507 [Pleurotus djamor]
MSSAVAEVLSTPKFLLHIVSLSTQKDNASNLLVNKAWAEEVMNVEWRDVDQVQWLLGLLAPFEEIEPPEDAEHDLCTLKFARSPEARDWDRFHRYAARVQYLIHQWSMFDPSVYATLSRYQDQTRTIFFPNLRHLCCLIDTDSLGLFLRPGLHSLTICYDLDRSSVDIQRLEKSFSVVTQKCASSLQELSFNYRLGDDIVRSSENLLISVLRELRHLRTITIPFHWLSERVTQALALLPALARLESTGNGFSKRRTAIVPTFSTSLNKNSFPSLNHLHLVIHFDEAIPSFNSWGGSTRLRSLIIDSDRFESLKTYEALVKVIVKAFPLLRMLDIHANTKHIPPSTPRPQLTFRALEPILYLQDLRTLKISYTTPLYLVTGDLFEIFWSLASITSLELNPNPPIRTTSSLHLTCLSAAYLARSDIRSLRLYVDTSPRGFDVAMKATQRLDDLESVDFGYSVISTGSIALVGEYLSLALPAECKIKAQTPGERRYHASPEWKKVFSSIPAFTQATCLGDIGEVHRLRIALSH